MAAKEQLSLKQKRELQASVIWAYTKQGALQRAWLYKTGRDDEQWNRLKKDFRLDIRTYLYEKLFLKANRRVLTEEQLRKIIFDFRQYLIRRYPDLIDKNSFSFGNAQKFINLYLKGLWIFGKAKCPPHFPVDRIIQQRGIKGQVIPWTDMTQPQYKSVIQKVKSDPKAETKNLAVWEALKYLEWSTANDDE